MKTKFFLIIFILITLTNVNAQKVKDVSLIKTNNKIYINARLDIDKNILDEVFELLHNGVKVTIVYIINIYKERPFYLIMDSNIKNIEYKKIVRYNMWEKQYYLIDGKEKKRI